MSHGGRLAILLPAPARGDAGVGPHGISAPLSMGRRASLCPQVRRALMAWGEGHLRAHAPAREEARREEMTGRVGANVFFRDGDVNLHPSPQMWDRCIWSAPFPKLTL